MVLQAGIEPATPWASTKCSTAELLQHDLAGRQGIEPCTASFGGSPAPQRPTYGSAGGIRTTASELTAQRAAVTLPAKHDVHLSMNENLARIEGVEPPLPGPEPGVLPLDDIRMVPLRGLEPLIVRVRTGCLSCLASTASDT